MAHKKAQGAMEYLLAYGWAILVVIIVGVVLWHMGIFKPSGGAAPGISGFGDVRPLEWTCSAGPGASDTVTISIVNSVGGTITNASIAVGGSTAPCSPSLVQTSGTAICAVAGVDCGAESSGGRYEVSLSIRYSSPAGIDRASSGAIWGPAE
jgi:hypothetical protein